ncbi:serine phosphatase RsbU (regulator of sigma subunit) [Streptomyces sp. PanSC19]|uniref:PP2C family protein-serine/threonine phosphatase n=1 Tax=Streptomyces sp. PanSC19 TaxID=1520455 RepID=UPI000F480585|nr:PP2C family protein-serine/threonine phosphatase [Streptomyces sp. PanSC19]ROQ26601.1 serine phosphatase RsbU (regulator of sigma subunit) [Streptomyces sp. PanSC19]
MTVFEDEPGLSRATPMVAGTSWLRSPHPALVADGRGSVVEFNDAAADLFPEMDVGAWLDEVVPGWLAEAHRRLTRPPRKRPVEKSVRAGRPALRGSHEGRLLRAHPTDSGHGDVAWWLVDDSDLTAAEEALRTEQERTALLAEASTQLLSSLNPDRCLEKTALLAAAHLADAALVISPPVRNRHGVVAAVGDRVTGHQVTMDPTAVPGLAEALQGFPPVPARWIDPAELPEWAVPEGVEGPPGSVSITSLPGHGVPAGALILLRRSGRTAFDASEELFARLFAARAGAALSAARMYAEQARITRALIAELLPPQLHHVHGVDFAGGYRTSHDTERIGGDFYDVHAGTDADQESLAVLGDVCGKGLDAAVLTGRIRSTLHALLPLADDHQNVLRLLNGALLTARHTRFATLVLASVRRTGGRVRLRLTSAGHPGPLILRTTGEVEEADTSGTLVGALPEVTSRSTTVHLAPGETCLLYTDGITEARGGPLGSAMFGEERLRTALADCVGLPAEAVVERIQMIAGDWVGGGPHDDMAIVAITAPHTTHLSAVNGHTRGRYTA